MNNAITVKYVRKGLAFVLLGAGMVHNVSREQQWINAALTVLFVLNARMTLTLTEPGFKLTGFVPRRREEIEAKVKEARAERERPPPEGDLEEAVATKEDIMSGIQSAANPVALTRGRRFRAKYSHYLRTYAYVIVIFLIIALLLVARILGWI